MLIWVSRLANMVESMTNSTIFSSANIFRTSCMYLLLALASKLVTLGCTRKPSSFHCRAADRWFCFFPKRVINTGWSFCPAGWHANTSAVDGSDCEPIHIVNPRLK